MNRLLWLASWRHMLRHPWQLALAAAPSRTFRLLGLDILAESPLRGGMMAQNAGSFDPAALFSDPSAVIVPAQLAEELGLVQGSELELLAGPGTARARVIGVADADVELRGLLLADVGAAQALLGRAGVLTRIDLVLNEQDAGTVGAIRRYLTPGTRLERSETRSRSVAQLSDSFHLNLTAMSLLAMLVGLFLIYNTMTFSVIQRRDLLGRLRAPGVGRREIFVLVTLEALLLGFAGTVLGLTLGIVLGGGLLDLVARTIDDLYYTLPLRQFHLAPFSLVKGLILGTVATLAAAFFPAWEAAATEPCAVLVREV